MSVTAETELERRIIDDPEWRAGAAWGVPSRAHPEASVGEHVEDVLRNVDRYAADPEQRARLRLIALVHDTLKFRVRRWLPRVGLNDHARLARRFAQRYISDAGVLDVIELHDEGYRAWKRGGPAAERRAHALIERLGGELDLFLAFYRCDNEAGDKAPTDREWFEALARGERLPLSGRAGGASPS